MLFKLPPLLLQLFDLLLEHFPGFSGGLFQFGGGLGISRGVTGSGCAAGGCGENWYSSTLPVGGLGGGVSLMCVTPDASFQMYIC